MPAVYYIPSGPLNLSSIFGSVDWNDVDEYYLEAGICTTPIFKVSGCVEDAVVHFVNYLGCIDSSTFDANIDHETKAQTYRRPLPFPLEKAQPGITRFAIKSNDSYTFVAVFPEDQLSWLQELFDAPLAWVQLKAAQGQSEDYIPLVISDQSFTKLKTDERFNYEVQVKATLSHNRSIISS